MRLIDADALKENWTFISEAEKREIDDAPTIDAVQVVRCKDCKYWNEWENGTGNCERSENAYFWYGTDFNDFCSFGERSEE